jgi:hypothetical protein
MTCALTAQNLNFRLIDMAGTTLYSQDLAAA